jgi:uncharacterized protein (DUF2147 family)
MIQRRFAVLSLLLSGGLIVVGGSAALAAPPAATKADSGRLVGKWRRLEGGYIIDVRAAGKDGKLDAAYFNPRPINVSQAQWKRGPDQSLGVFVELRDTGYPGATYRLVYAAAEDRLTGTYTQPAAGQTFEVTFVRQK